MRNISFKFIEAVAGMLLSACNQSSNQTAGNTTVSGAPNAPVMKFEKEAYDFGKIKSGDKVSTYDFKFTNTGKSPLIITDGSGDLWLH